MQETVRQHYVPRTYLKHFAKSQDEKYIIGFIPISKMSPSAYNEVNIEKICLEKHLYTMPGATPEERMWIENLYSEAFEKNYDRVYEMLIDENKEHVSAQERHQIISTVVSMYYRTTNWNRYSDEITDTIFDRMYGMAKAYGKTSFMLENTEVSIEGKTPDDLKKEYKEKEKPVMLLAQIQHIIKLLNIRSLADTIIITKLDKQDGGFITSDNPVTCDNINEGHIMPIDPTNMLSLPLDSRHHLSILPNKNPDWRHSIYRNTFAEDIALFPKVAANSRQHRNAERFLLGSEKALKSYFDETELMRNPDEKTKKVIEVMEAINRVL